MNMNRKLALICVLLTQEVSAFDPIEDPKIENELPGLSTTELNSGNNSFSIYSGTDKTSALIRFGTNYNKSSKVKWNVTIEAPFDEDDKTTILGDFDGLSNVSNIAFNLSGFKVKDREIADEYSIAVNELCTSLMENEGAQFEDCIDGEMRTSLKKSKSCQDKSENHCNAYIDKLLDDYHDKRLELYNSFVKQDIQSPLSAQIYGAEFKTGYGSYRFRNPENLNNEEVNKTSWSFSLYYNYLKHNTVYGAGLSFQKSYNEMPKIELCEPLDIFDSTLSCLETRLGAPEEQERNIAYVQMSHHSTSHNFAIQPKISYDIEEKEFGVIMPIFLMRNEKDQLTGGLQLSWQSEDDDLVAGVFVGKAFKFY